MPLTGVEKGNDGAAPGNDGLWKAAAFQPSIAAPMRWAIPAFPPRPQKGPRSASCQLAGGASRVGKLALLAALRLPLDFVPERAVLRADFEDSLVDGDFRAALAAFVERPGLELAALLSLRKPDLRHRAFDEDGRLAPIAPHARLLRILPAH